MIFRQTMYGLLVVYFAMLHLVPAIAKPAAEDRGGLGALVKKRVGV